MKRILLIIFPVMSLLVSCKDDDINKFDKPADVRVAEAKAALKADLTAPANGWKIKYTPESGFGSYYVLLDFEQNNFVRIRTDLGANNGEFFEDTVTYRIDSSLGLELIIESYSFFAYLFEQDQASFGAEYEFNYVNKTPDGSLVFNSKSDVGVPTIMLFQPASASDVNLLGRTISTNLNTMAEDIERFTSSLKLTYTNRDLILYLSMDPVKRVINFNAASNKTNTNNTATINFDIGYIIKGDSIVLESPLTRNVLGTNISIKSMKLNTLGNATLNPCGTPIPVHNYQGVTSANDQVVLETTLVDVNGKSFATLSDFYFAPLSFIFNDGKSVASAITNDIKGALEMHLYYNLKLNDGTSLYGIGFVLQNANNTTTFALKEFTPVLNDNNIVFNFKPGFRLFGNQTPDADLNKITTYLDALAQDNKTYVFEYSDDIYEFYNPCSKWSFVFINGNQ